mgnify:CR=1 FL=1
MAKEAHKDFWDGYERSTQNQIIRKYYRAIIAEDKKRRMDMFLNRLKQSYDKVSGWSKEKVATVKQAWLMRKPAVLRWGRPLPGSAVG